MRRISRQQLEELTRLLAGRDKDILRSILKCRYLASGQIQRLHFTEHANRTAALRAANRALAKLNEYGLIRAMKRRIGGIEAGSGANVWLLSEAGVRLLNLNSTDASATKQFFTPSHNFLKHTLAVAEVYVQLNDLCRQQPMSLIKSELEPTCWRGYTGEGGSPATMKPDMFAVTGNGEYEDSWFIEVDLNTESPKVVLDKCRRYCLYYKTGIEQKKSGVFPLVVWIVPTVSRKDKLKCRIAEHRELPYKQLFTVITPDEFEPLICGGKESAA